MIRSLPGTSRRRPRLAGAALVLVAAALVAAVAYRTHAARVPRTLRLADGTTASFLAGTRVQPARLYPQPREITVDGDAFIRAAQAPTPLIVRSRLLVLTVTGASAFRITAYSSRSGEQVEVLRGHVVARKAYPSSYSAPDVLVDGEMTMINRTVDLMEKEKLQAAELRELREGFARRFPSVDASARHPL